MIHVKDHKQYDMFNPFEHLGPKRLALLESSWAHLFREEILHKLPAEQLFPLYSKHFGRRTKELYAMLGIVLLQQQHDLTDDEAIQQFSFNIMWHYALNVTDPSDVSSYVSPRTLWTMRDIVGRLGLEQSLFENVTGALTKLFELDPSKQRLDSIHIFSNMAHLGRIRLFVRTIRKFLVNLKRHHADLHQALGEVAVRYEEKNDGRFAVKPSESSRTLQEVGDDCFLLVERFKDHEAVVAMATYQHLLRLFTEQCVVEKTDSATSVVVKPNKDVPSNSLQNPSDPDAGYCGHKGKGYQMQVMETYSPDKSQPNFITHVKVEAAHESDSNALLPAIEDAAKRELAPKELLADSLYGSDDNLEQAKELGVEVVSPTMGTQSQAIGLADFAFSDSDEITACPEGKKPLRTKTGKHGGKIAHFDKALCDHCPRQSDCPVKRVKRSVTISYDAKALRLARRRAKEKTEAFREVYRFRAGAEGTMSDLDRITGIKRLRVRGMPQVRLAAVLKATGLNVMRATTFKNRLRREEKRKARSNHSPNGLIGVVKEQILRLRDFLEELSGYFHPVNNQIVRFASQAA
ncbi:MAG: transposase [Geobacteraceae bacterium]|nr:transposase [Geobacteraceae bacterium]